MAATMSHCEIDSFVGCLDVEFSYIRSCIFHNKGATIQHHVPVTAAVITFDLGGRTRCCEAYSNLWTEKHQASFFLPTRDYLCRIMAFVSAVVSNGTTYEAGRYENTFHTIGVTQPLRKPK